MSMSPHFLSPVIIYSLRCFLAYRTPDFSIFVNLINVHKSFAVNSRSLVHFSAIKYLDLGLLKMNQPAPILFGLATGNAASQTSSCRSFSISVSEVDQGCHPCGYATAISSPDPRCGRSSWAARCYSCQFWSDDLERRQFIAAVVYQSANYNVKSKNNRYCSQS